MMTQCIKFCSCKQSLSISYPWMGQLLVSCVTVINAVANRTLIMIWHLCPSAASPTTFHLTAGSDYQSGPYTVSFSAGQMYAILMVGTLDDSTTELSEYFKMAINSTDQPSVVEIGSPNTSFITIEDNDPGKH